MAYHARRKHSQAKATMFKTGGGPKPKEAEIDDLSQEIVDVTGRTFTIPNPYDCGEGENSGWDNSLDEQGRAREVVHDGGASSDALALQPAGDSPGTLPVADGPPSPSVPGRANASRRKPRTQETAAGEEVQTFVRTAKACRVEESESKRELLRLSILEKEASLKSLKRKRDIDEAQLEFETKRKKLIIIQQEEASFKAKIVKLEFAAKKVEIQRKLNLTDQELEDLLG